MGKRHFLLWVFAIFIVTTLFPGSVNSPQVVASTQTSIEWHDPQPINPNPNIIYQELFQVEASNGHCFVLWENKTVSRSKLYLLSSFDGTAWEAPIIMNESNETSYANSSPAISVEGERIHVVWGRRVDLEHHDLVYHFYNGSMWFPEVMIGSEYAETRPYDVHVVAENEKLHLVYSDYVKEHLYYLHYDGSTWHPPVEIGLLPNGASWAGSGSRKWLDMAAEKGNVHVIWGQKIDDSFLREIFYQHFDGETWHTPELVTSAGRFPAIAVGNNIVHIVWETTGKNEFDIVYRSFDGTMWQDRYGLSPKDTSPFIRESSHSPAIVEHQGQVYVVWIEYPYETSPQDFYSGKIMFCYFDGITWHPEEIIQDQIGPHSHTPLLAVDQDTLHLVWSWDLPNFVGIYHRYGTLRSVSTAPVEPNDQDTVTSPDEDGGFLVPSEGIFSTMVTLTISVYLLKRKQQRKS